eukprot:sb/3473194/
MSDVIQPMSMRPQMIALNPFGDHLKIEDDLILRPVTEEPFEKLAVNPLGGKLQIEYPNASTGYESDGFQYRRFYISQVVIIPSLVMMVVFSLLLLYVILRHLRGVLKLYLSVIYYALSILFFASQIIWMIFSDMVRAVLDLTYSTRSYVQHSVI